MINNTPEIKLGIVAVSRDCFPNSLSENRRKAVVKAYDGEIYECPIIVENEIDMMNALEDLKKAECDALVVYLGNFGPETEETLLVKYFDGPCMVVAAAEETGDDLVGGRGDAYCGVLNASYNLKLRNLHAYIPEYPVGDAEDVAAMIKDFVPVATAVVAVKNLKIISFGPRPTNFLACNAPIKQLYNLGVEIEENSELDLFEAFNKHAGDERIPAVVEDMAKELGEGNLKPEILPKLAQYEITLLDWIEAHKGSRKYVTLTGKCWPAFQTQFGFVPCYVNSRLTSQGIPVSCEVDIYGTLSEFIGQVVSDDIVTLLDINNKSIEGKPEDLVINTHVCRGNFHSTYASSGAYTGVAATLFAKENVNAYYLEYDDERSGGFEPLKNVTGDKKVVLGLITTKFPELEDEQTVIDRINEAAKYIPLERLCLSPQCGFASCEIGNKLTEDEQWAKLRLVKRIADKVWG